jgi:hypothetical protein
MPASLPMTSAVVLNIAVLMVKGPGEFAFDLILEDHSVGSLPFAAIDAALPQVA